MKYILLLTLLGLTTLFSAKNSNQKDFIDPFKQVIKLHITQPDSALQLLNQMESEHQFPIALINSQRSLVYINNSKYRLAANYAEKALQYDLLKQYPKQYLQAVTSCVEAYERLCEYKKALTLLRKGIRYAHKKNMKAAQTELTYSIGHIQYRLGNLQEAKEKVMSAIHMAQEDQSPEMKHHLVHFYDHLSDFFIQEKRYQEALETIKKQEKIIADIKKQPEGYPLGYYEKACCLFYSKQAYVYALLKQMAQAEKAYQKFTHFGDQSTPDSNENIIKYWLETAQYNQILVYIQNLKQPIDTLNIDFAKQLSLLATVHEKLQDYPRAFHYQRRHDIITDSLHHKNKKDDVAELAAIYQLQEKEHRIVEQNKEMHHINTTRNLILGALIITGTLLGLVVWKNRIIRKKNTLMAQSLNTICSKQEEIKQLEQQLATQKHQPKDEKSQDCHLFKQIEKIFMEEKLHLNPNFNRQEILDRLGIDKNHFSKLMQEQANMTFIQYITQLRVNHAIQQLKIHTNYTMQAIAEESGFSNLRTFQRAFKSLTNMTPTEYKNGIKGDNLNT